MKRAALLFVCFFTCVLFSFCQTNNTTVSAEEALATAKKLEMIVQEKNKEAYIAFFDLPSMRATLAKKSRAIKEKQAKEEGIAPFLFTPLANAAIKSGEIEGYHFLRNYEKEGYQHLLFRIITDGGLNYFDFQLIKTNDQVKAADAISYHSGEEITTIMADGMDAMLPPDPGMPNAEKYADALLLMVEMRNKGDNQGIKEEYERLPATLQQRKGLLRMYISVCKKIDGEAYKAAIEKLMAYFPGYNTHLMMVDIYLEDKEYDKVLNALNKLDEMVHDPFLDHYRGAVYMFMNKQAECIAAYERAYNADPYMRGNLAGLVRAYMEYNETDKAKKVLKEYKSSKAFNQKELDLINASHPALFN